MRSALDFSSVEPSFHSCHSGSGKSCCRHGHKAFPVFE